MSVLRDTVTVTFEYQVFIYLFTRLKTFLFTRAYGTSPYRLRDSLGCKDRRANINFLTYLLTYLLIEQHVTNERANHDLKAVAYQW